MVEGGKAPWNLKKAAKKLLLQTCGSFSWRQRSHHPVIDTNVTTSVSSDSATYISHTRKPEKSKWSVESEISSVLECVAQAEPSPNSTSHQSLCAICLDPLNYGSGSNEGQAIFTAECSHSFHFSCISSNVCHGNVTCPICRAHWSQLPRDLTACRAIRRVSNVADPVLQILDNSIETFRVHRQSFVRSARYDDDDPIAPNHMFDHPRLHFSLLPMPHCHLSTHQCSYATHMPNFCHIICEPSSPLNSSSMLVESPTRHSASTTHNPCGSGSTSGAYLCARVAEQPATDLVLVASPNGSHLRLLQQCMAMVVSSLRPVDRLAIVTYSSAAARVFPLRCMTSYGKRTALQVIGRLLYMGEADPIEGLKKGVKILGDRVHRNPHSCILHLSDSPTRSYHQYDMEVTVSIHSIHIGYGFGSSNGFVMHEFEDYLARILGGAIKDVKLRVGENTRITNLGELRGGEERRIPINLNKHGRASVAYSYIDTGLDECRTGEIEMGIGDKRERNGNGDVNYTVGSTGRRTSSVENGDYYHDPFVARRWAKRLNTF